MISMEIIQLAINEDLPNGDLTTDNLNLEQDTTKAKLVAKEDLILSGREFFNDVMKVLAPTSDLKWYFEDGQLMLAGQIACLMKGSTAGILKAERIALNFIGHFSGIASLTRKFVDKTKHTRAKILDTRKTLPLYRGWEKKAVRDGGGTNHRLNLSERILIKDNHIEACGGIRQAVERIRSKTQVAIEVEVKSLSQIHEATELKVQRIMLDNMTNSQMKEAITLIPKDIEVEASGNMTLERVTSVAELGVDFISVGALTHSAPCADLSLEFEWKTT